MTEPGDFLGWPAGEVTPLFPPPGTLARIRRRARRRRMRRALTAAAGCALLGAAAVTVPGLLTGPAGQGGRITAAGTPGAVTRQPLLPASPAAGTLARRAVQLHQRTRLSAAGTATAPPPHFRPTSVTFAGTGSGGLVGAVIGQAGPPCATADCTSLAQTPDYGRTWYGVSAPVAPGPARPGGVSQLRFSNVRDGWAFGPALYETAGGGWPWQRVAVPAGQVVIALEASGSTALAVFATCAGTGADYASGCTSFELYRGTAGSQAWSPVGVPAGDQPMRSASAASVHLVISGTAGYLLTPTGTVLTGPVTGTGAWTAAAPPPGSCAPGPAGASRPGALLAAASGRLLIACPAPGGGRADLTLSDSADNGRHWTSAGTAPLAGAAAALAVTAAGRVVLAGPAGISVSPDGGKTWQAAAFGGSGPPPGGFRYAGMTGAQLGVAVPARAALGEIYVTRDGGQTWTPSAVSG